MKTFVALLCLGLASTSAFASTSPEVLDVQVLSQDGTVLISTSVSVETATPIIATRETSYIKECNSAEDECRTGFVEEGVRMNISRVADQKFTVDIAQAKLIELSVFTSPDGKTIELPELSSESATFTLDFSEDMTSHTRPVPGGGRVVISLKKN